MIRFKEIKFSTDKKQKNLRIPVSGKKGTSKYGRMKAAADDKSKKKANEHQLVGTDEYTKHAKSMTPGETKNMKNENGLWDNIHKKRARIKKGSGEKMRKPGSKGAPTDKDFKDASEEAPATSTSSIPNIPGLQMTQVTDKRRKANKQPLMLKRFREYLKK
jgi:hypothetical protein|tara:strand:- start:575 stop:1057 length:483 start_codon:yes stop_codon:yes gene_type:complete